MNASEDMISGYRAARSATGSASVAELAAYSWVEEYLKTCTVSQVLKIIESEIKALETRIKTLERNAQMKSQVSLWQGRKFALRNSYDILTKLLPYAS